MTSAAAIEVKRRQKLWCLFWQANIMQAFRDNPQKCYTVSAPVAITPAKFWSLCDEPENTCSICSVIDHTTHCFWFEVRNFGCERWVAVTDDAGSVIIPPFGLPAAGPAALPLFPEEIDRCSRFR